MQIRWAVLASTLALVPWGVAAQSGVPAQSGVSARFSISSEWRALYPLDSLDVGSIVARVTATPVVDPDDPLLGALAGLAGSLSYDPPGMEPPWGEGGRRYCTLETCRMLADALEGYPAPVDAFAFAVRWATDPVAWSDSLLARSDSASPMLERARSVALAALAPPGSSEHALPGPDAGWEEWRDFPHTFASDRIAHYKIDLARELTGRDVRAEIGEKYQVAEGDSARLILGFHAMRLGVAEVTLEETLSNLQSPSPVVRQHAQHQVENLRRRAVDADSALTAELQGQALELLLNGQPSWTSDPILGPTSRILLPGSPLRTDDRRIVLLSRTALDPGVAQDWEIVEGVSLTSIEQVTDHDEPERWVHLVSVGQGRVVGPFVWFTASIDTSMPQQQASSIFGGYSASVYDFTLLPENDGWRVLEVTELAVN